VRRAYCFPAAALFFIASAMDGGTQAAVIKPEKRRSIYLTIKGPEAAAAKLRALFEEAALNKDLFIADDPHQAGSKVKITISDEREVAKHFYAELVTATLLPREGQSSTVSFCKQVTDGAGFTTLTTAYWTPAKASVPAHSTLWVENESGSRALADLVRTKVREAGFQMAASASEAEFTLKDVRLVKVPLQVTAREARVQSEMNIADGSMASLSGAVQNYLPVTEPISSEAEGCRKTIAHIGDSGLSGYGQIAMMDVAIISARIRK
jgi:hypothetical protein